MTFYLTKYAMKKRTEKRDFPVDTTFQAVHYLKLPKDDLDDMFIRSP